MKKAKSVEKREMQETTTPPPYHLLLGPLLCKAEYAGRRENKGRGKLEPDGNNDLFQEAASW